MYFFPLQIEFNEGETLTLLDNGKQGKWLVCLNPFNFLKYVQVLNKSFSKATLM